MLDELPYARDAEQCLFQQVLRAKSWQSLLLALFRDESLVGRRVEQGIDLRGVGNLDLDDPGFGGLFVDLVGRGPQAPSFTAVDRAGQPASRDR